MSDPDESPSQSPTPQDVVSLAYRYPSTKLFALVLLSHRVVSAWFRMSSAGFIVVIFGAGAIPFGWFNHGAHFSIYPKAVHVDCPRKASSLCV